MYSRKYSYLTRFISVLLVIILLVPNTVYADSVEQNPRASYYLDSYNTYTYNAALGKIQIYFDVTGVNYMDEIGVLTIQLYESTDSINWTWVKTYKYNTSSGMLGYDKIYHSGHVDYQGTIGRYYKAYVCVWAGKNGEGDTRYLWTNIDKATLLAG